MEEITFQSHILLQGGCIATVDGGQTIVGHLAYQQVLNATTFQETSDIMSVFVQILVHVLLSTSDPFR